MNAMVFRCPPELMLRSAISVSHTFLTSFLKSVWKLICPSVSSPRAFSTVVPRASSSSSSYQAVICHELGKPLLVTVQNRSPISAKQVRVSIDYAAMNFADILTVTGQYQVKPPLPFVPGMEYCGRVAEIGADVSDLAVGDRVVGMANYGAFADELVTEQLIYRVDSSLPPAEAAAILGSYATAYASLVRYARINSGEVVLVTAAAGALGLASVDLAANVFGAKVIGVCGGAEKCQLVKSYGAVETIDYTKEDVKDRIKELTRGKGVDIVVEVVGGKVFGDCLKSMAFDGRLLTLGYTSGEIPKIPANLLLVKNFSVHGVYFGVHALKQPDVFHDTIKSVLKLWKDGKIRPLVGKIFSLKEVNEAMQYIASRKSTGKVLLQCGQN